MGDIGNLFNQKATLQPGKDGDAKASRACPVPDVALPGLQRFHFISGDIYALAEPAARRTVAGSSWQLSPGPFAPPFSPLQGRPGVLTRRAAAQLAATGTGLAQVRAVGVNMA